MTMMTTKIKKTLSLLLLLQAGGLLLLFISKEVFVSFEIAMISGAMITAGSLYAYRNMIRSRIEHSDVEDSKDAIDMMDDPYDLYEEEREEEIADIKAMIKAEKAKQRHNLVQNTTKNASAWVSAYRLIPYAFLILGFIALQKNEMLLLLPYMVGLAVGIVMGYLISREWLI